MQTFLTLSAAPKKTIQCPSVVKSKAPPPKIVSKKITLPPPKKKAPQFEIIALNRSFETAEEIEAWISAMPDLKGAMIHRTWKKELIFCEVKIMKERK